jgi:hypothetical protein
MKSVLKQLIRDATNQRPTADDEEGPSFEQDVGYIEPDSELVLSG